MADIYLNLGYVCEAHECLKKHYNKLRKMESLSYSDKDIGKKIADAMVRNVYKYYYQVKDEVLRIKKTDRDAKIIHRRVKETDNYARKMYELCGYDYR